MLELLGVLRIAGMIVYTRLPTGHTHEVLPYQRQFPIQLKFTTNGIMCALNKQNARLPAGDT